MLSLSTDSPFGLIDLGFLEHLRHLVRTGRSMLRVRVLELPPA
jgi:hypothetical protein